MIKKTQKQADAISLICDSYATLLYGGSGSGKSIISIYAIVVRALMSANTDHLIVRKFNNSIRRSIWSQSLPYVLKSLNIQDKCHYDKSQMIITLPNNSKILCVGCDNPKTMDRILGIEAASLYIDECSEIDFSQYEVLVSRLRQKMCCGKTPKIILSCNPTSKKSWIYKYFIEKKSPINGLPHNVKVNAIQLNPVDANYLDKSYLTSLQNLSERQRKRFFNGEFQSQEEGALWTFEIIENNRKISPKEFERIVIGVDPAMTNTEKADSTGIVVCGKLQDHYYVLRDATIKGKPKEIVNRVRALHKIYHSDKIICEKNQGGDWVSDAIGSADPTIPIEAIHAKVGKICRAEGPAYLYEKGLVHHTQIFTDLEDQMVSYTGKPDEESPDNLDALVYAISELSFNPEQKLDFNFGDR